jgi:biotin carboxylase
LTSNIHVTLLEHAAIFPNKSPESTDLLNLKSSNREARNAAFTPLIPDRAGAGVDVDVPEAVEAAVEAVEAAEGVVEISKTPI